uniref:B3 domain-containing protein n=1 Tax=Solanum tuberosum TaxID=4113 RepID=M1DCJ6_SOLTU
MEKGFFKVFNPKTSAKRMKIPTGYTNYKNEKLPRKVFLRDRYGNMWPIRVTKQGRDIYFKYGWEKFIEDNNMEFADFLIIDYDWKGIFDFKLLGINGCVKNGAGGKKKGEEMNVEHEKSVESKEKTWVSDSSNSSSDYDSDEHYMVEEDVVKEDVEMKQETHKRASCSKRRYVEEEEDEKREGEGEEKEAQEEEDEEENEGAGTYTKKVQHSKVGCQKSNACKYIPMDVLRDYKLELPPSMTIRDSACREFETRVSKWTDGRIWLLGGWRNLGRFNLVEKDDRYICEFVRGKCGKGLYLQVQVLHEGSSSHLDNK